MRLFFSLSIPPDPIFEEIYGSLAALGHGRLKVVRPDLHHVTLKFLGETGAAVDELSGAVTGAADHIGPFDLHIGGPGAFPSWDRPSVIWIGFEDQSSLRELALALNDGLHASGIDKENFHGHITLARVRKNKQLDIAKIRALLDEKALGLREKGYVVHVDGFDLMSSTLTPEGPIYNKVRTYRLSRPKKG